MCQVYIYAILICNVQSVTVTMLLIILVYNVKTKYYDGFKPENLHVP